MAHIIRGLPEMYGTYLTEITGMDATAIDEGTITDLCTKVTRHWEILTKSRASREQDLENGLAGIDLSDDDVQQESDQKQLMTVLKDTIKALNDSKKTPMPMQSNPSSELSQSSSVSSQLTAIQAYLRELSGAAVAPAPGAMMQASGRIRGPMICYRCGQEDHRANTCPNAPNPALVKEKLTALGRTECIHCGGWHKKEGCWLLEENAHMRPPNWRPFIRPGFPKTDNGQTVAVPRASNREVGHMLIDGQQPTYDNDEDVEAFSFSTIDGDPFTDDETALTSGEQCEIIQLCHKKKIKLSDPDI